MKTHELFKQSIVLYLIGIWFFILSESAAVDSFKDSSQIIIMKKKTIETVISENRAALMDRPGVVAVGLGKTDGQLCIKILLTQPSLVLRESIPDSLEGYPVIMEISGEINALD
ncbi:MAG: hypothetical protein HQK83_02700 [Fibrobacteria bacterium]|nr:hypothetical protein [Fibrobacteria bacterium]